MTRKIRRRKPEDRKREKHPSSVSWQAAAFHFHPKGARWNIGVGMVSLALAYLFYRLQSLSLIYIVLLAALVLVLESPDRPKKQTHTITKSGLLIDNRLLRWNDLKSFWLVTSPEGDKLYLETTLARQPLLTFYLSEAKADRVREALLGFLPEHPTRGEHLADMLARLLRI